VFTARYALSPYITQIRFVSRGLRVVKIPTLPLVLVVWCTYGQSGIVFKISEGLLCVLVC